MLILRLVLLLWKVLLQGSPRVLLGRLLLLTWILLPLLLESLRTYYASLALGYINRCFEDLYH